MTTFQSVKLRLLVAGFLLTCELLSRLIINNDLAELYFIICALFNLAILSILPVVKNTNFISDLQKMNFVELLVQFSGWVLYEFYFEPTAYNTMIFALNSAQIFRLIWANNDRNIKGYLDWSYIFSFDIHSLGENTKGEIRRC